MAVKGNPGGFPQRKLKDTPTVTPGQMRENQRAAQEVIHFDILQAVENAGLATAQARPGIRDTLAGTSAGPASSAQARAPATLRPFLPRFFFLGRRDGGVPLTGPLGPPR